jgi:sugar phosphate isomerase/epimerase
MKLPFKLGVITDEISDDFDHACFVAAKGFGMQWVELRTLWGKNVADLNMADVGRAQVILKKYGLGVTQIASPLFKVHWPDAPRSKFGPQAADQAAIQADFKKQDDVLAACIALAGIFTAKKVRCFDFWRLDDVTPYRTAIDDKLRQAAMATRKEGILLALENDHECNTATSAEAARLLDAAQVVVLSWNPANAVMHGELDAYPAGWAALPKQRVFHIHCKNVARDTSGKLQWSPVDVGIIDWAAYFGVLKQMYDGGAVSLETHWRGGGTPEASTRISWAGMKKALDTSGTL